MARSRDFLLAPASATPVVDAGLLILRVGMGLALALAHGWGKIPPSEGFVGMVGGLGFPAPALFAWLAALAEFGGGLLLVIGLFTRPAAIFVTVHLLFVVLVAHAGDAFGQRELSFLFLVWAVTLLLTGAGRYSADGMMNRRTAGTAH